MLSSDLSIPMQAILGVQLGLRFCTKCGELKPSLEFHSHPGGDGKHPSCKTCRSEESKGYYLANREHKLEVGRAYVKRLRSANPDGFRKKERVRRRIWRSSNPELTRERARKYYRSCPEAFVARQRKHRLKAKYSMSVQQYDAKVLAQGGLCWACKLPPSLGETLNVDHSHTTNKVRGLLCRDCNVSFGLVKENVTTLRGLIAYAEFFKEN